MQEFEGRTAVVTGAASGIGLAMAERFARAGMRLVLADVEAAALEKAEAQLAATGAQMLAVPTDVADAQQMDRLAERVRDRFGVPQLVCLNAGVAGGGGPIETLSSEDWAWAIGVNLWGVIHGLRVFLGDLKQANEGHVVITSSIAGIICSPNAGPYHATKHAVAAIAETLFRELSDANSQVGVSCLCPGLVSTNFPFGERNRPVALQKAGASAVPPEQEEAIRQAVNQIFERGATPAHVAECVFDAVREQRFWIKTDDVHREAIRARHRAIEDGEPPPTNFGALDGY